MYPNQPVPPSSPVPPQPPVDYLDHIAPQAPKPSPFKLGPKLFAIIGAALIVVVIALSISINVIVNNQKQPLERLAARLTATETIVTDAQAHLKSSQLRSLNSSLRLYLTNVNRDMGETLAGANVNTAKLSETIVKEESTDEITGRLDDARLNAVYDRTYSREIAFQLATTMALLQEIYAGNYSDEIKTFAKDIYDNLDPTYDAFDSYDAA